MAGDRITEVKPRMGFLWSIFLIIWIVIGLILLAVLVLGTLAMIALLPKISGALSTVSALSSLGSGTGGVTGNNNYGGSSLNGSGSGNQSASNAQSYLASLALQMQSDVNQGNWSAAGNEMNTIQTVLLQIPPSKLPSGLMQAITKLNQSIADRNATAFNNIFNQLSTSS